MTSPQDKLDHVLDQLKIMALPDEKSDPDQYWMMVEVAGDNSTDYTCDMDEAIKELIDFIEGP